MEFQTPFKGCVNGDVMPTEFEAGDECPAELEEAAMALGALPDLRPRELYDESQRDIGASINFKACNDVDPGTRKRRVIRMPRVKLRDAEAEIDLTALADAKATKAKK